MGCKVPPLGGRKGSQQEENPGPDSSGLRSSVLPRTFPEFRVVIQTLLINSLFGSR